MGIPVSALADDQTPLPRADVPKRRRLNADERRSQIVAAAREVFIEQGVQGARTRHIAERAGITEAYLYRKFHSKDELYRLAVDEPLEELTSRLISEMRELALRDVPRSELVLAMHRLVLECMVQVAPLIGAALCANRKAGQEFYTDYLFPKFRSALEIVATDITGRSFQDRTLDLFVEAMIGMHLTIALDHLLEGQPVNVPKVAEQATRMFASGIGRDAAAVRRPRRAESSAPTA